MRQIPKKALPLTAQVRVPDPESDRGGAFLEAVEIEHVRYEQTHSIRRTDYQLADGTTGLLFVDAANSAGAFEVPAGAKVSVDGGGTWMTVNASHRFEAFNRVHHWELELR